MFAYFPMVWLAMVSHVAYVPVVWLAIVSHVCLLPYGIASYGISCLLTSLWYG